MIDDIEPRYRLLDSCQTLRHAAIDCYSNFSTAIRRLSCNLPKGFSSNAAETKVRLFLLPVSTFEVDRKP